MWVKGEGLVLGCTTCTVSTKGRIPDLQRSAGKVTRPWDRSSPAKSRSREFGDLLRGQRPRKRDQGSSSQKLNSLCCHTSSFDSNFVHIYFRYIISCSQRANCSKRRGRRGGPHAARERYAGHPCGLRACGGCNCNIVRIWVKCTKGRIPMTQGH